MRSAREMPPMSLLRTLSSGAAAGWRAVRRLPPVRRVRALLKLAADAGTQGYPPDTRRRLKIVNMIAYLIAITTLLYAVQQSLMDFHTFAPMIAINVGLVVTALLVPFAHRINELAGGLLLIGAEYAALFGFTDFFSRDGGAQLQYIIAAAACFVIFDLKRIRLIALLVLLALVLHLCGWFWFPASGQPFTRGAEGCQFPLYTGGYHHRHPHSSIRLLRVQPCRARQGRDRRGAPQRAARRHCRAAQG